MQFCQSFDGKNWIQKKAHSNFKYEKSHGRSLIRIFLVKNTENENKNPKMLIKM